MTDREKIEILITTLNEGAEVSTKTITIGDRTLFFNHEGEIWKIVFINNNVRKVVYP